MTATPDLANRAAALAEGRRQWPKLADLADELDALVEYAQGVIDAAEQVREAVDAKESAMELAPAERADELEAAWDSAVAALEELADNIVSLEAGLAG